MSPCRSIPLLLLIVFNTGAKLGEWPEPRQNAHLTSLQRLPGAMAAAPVLLAEYDLGRARPQLTIATRNAQSVALTIVGGELRCYDPAGKLLWGCHPPGLNFVTIASVEDFDGDGGSEVLLQAGRPADPYGAAALVSLNDGRLRWQHDVEPISYVWYLHCGNYLPGSTSKQIVVLMHGYPPDKQNGYLTLFEFAAQTAVPKQRWRFDFDQYTCFPTLLQSDVDGDGAKELVVQTHSRLWALDAGSGAVKQFLGWDVAPANVRSYGLTRFVDLDGDGREDLLCIANFAQHHEVLLNRGGKLAKAWHHGWDESVTTGKVATTWPLPAHADIDGDGRTEVVLSMYNSQNERGWLIRAYDAVTGELKYRQSGMIAAALVDLDGDGAAEILADATDDSDAARPDGSHAATHGKGASVLRARGGRFQIAWHDPHARAVRSAESNRPHVLRGGMPFALKGENGGGIGDVLWAALPVTERPNFAGVPALVGQATQLLVADFVGDERNELLVYASGKATVLELKGTKFTAARKYASTCLPTIADLDGDGRRELILTDVVHGRAPLVKAITPASADKLLWQADLPQSAQAGNPGPRLAYVRAGHFTGRAAPDVYAWLGAPVVRSVLIHGASGKVVWERKQFEEIERHGGPSHNHAAAFDHNGDGKDDLAFTNPDFFCVASGPTGDMLLGPVSPQKIFAQPSQGLYTLPAVLAGPTSSAPSVALVDGHYFQGVMSASAEPRWHAVPEPGDARCAGEAFFQQADGAWLMGFGRQNGKFACVNVSDGTLRWEWDARASATDAVACDVDGDGRYEFVFGTSHGTLCAIGDGGGAPRVVWTVQTGSGNASVIIADVNGDGRSDIFAATVDGYVKVYGAGK